MCFVVPLRQQTNKQKAALDELLRERTERRLARARHTRALSGAWRALAASARLQRATRAAVARLLRARARCAKRQALARLRGHAAEVHS